MGNLTRRRAIAIFEKYSARSLARVRDANLITGVRYVLASRLEFGGLHMRGVCLSLVTLGLVLTAGIAAAQEPSAKPGPAHEKLMKHTGEYTTVTQFTMKPGEAS